jgi:hypothetical protein
MGGEMTLEGTFDVTRLECWEVEEPGNWLLSNIIDVGEDFFLRVYFEGSGSTWDNMKALALDFHVQFYADGMGPGIPDVDLGSTLGTLGADDEYEIDSPMNQIDDAGLYRCGVTVTFPDWKGTLGFNEDCVIQVNPQEE